MDQVTVTKNEFRKQQWAKTIQECQNSGQTVVSWCGQHGINIKSYYYWLRKLRLSSIEESNLPLTLTKEEPAVFKKLEIVSPLPDTKAAVIIRLPNAILEVNEGASQQTVQAVLLALQSIC